MTMMRALLAAVTLVVLVPAHAAPAVAQTATCRPWCVQYSGRSGGGVNCGFVSFEQCRQTAQGSDVCTPNPFCPPQGGRRPR